MLPGQSFQSALYGQYPDLGRLGQEDKIGSKKVSEHQAVMIPQVAFQHMTGYGPAWQGFRKAPGNGIVHLKYQHTEMVAVAL